MRLKSLKMSKLSIDQKRLETLRRQLYGKEKNTDFKKAVIKPARQPSTPSLLTTPSSISAPRPSDASTQDLGYLKKDLAKVGILSVVAIGIQLLFYFTPLKALLNIKFF